MTSTKLKRLLGRASGLGLLVAALTLFAPIAQARLVYVQTCHFENETTSPCKAEFGTDADLERFITAKAWNSRSLACRNIARISSTLRGRWQQVWEATPNELVLSCLDPTTGRRFHFDEPSQGNPAYDAYNRAQTAWLATEMTKVAQPETAGPLGGACVPLTTYSMLQAGQPAEDPRVFRQYVEDLRRANYYSDAAGVSFVKVQGVFDAIGLPVDNPKAGYDVFFDTIPDALDEGKVVALEVGDIQLLDAGMQRALVAEALTMVKADRHFVRIVAVQRTPAGTVRQLAVYDPSLFRFGNKAYWVEPGALKLALLQSGDALRSGDTYRTFGVFDPVYISKMSRVTPRWPQR